MLGMPPYPAPGTTCDASIPWFMTKILSIPLALLSASLADLSGETSLDGSNTATRSTGVASNEVQSVFSLVEFSVWRPARLAGNIFH